MNTVTRPFSALRRFVGVSLPLALIAATISSGEPAAASVPHTRIVSVSSSGAVSSNYNENPVVSANGRFVAFESPSTNLIPNDENGVAYDVYLRDMWAGTTSLVSQSTKGDQGDQDSLHADISANGRYVVFQSAANNLVHGDTNNRVDVFVRDTLDGRTTLVSSSLQGTSGNGDSVLPAISANGRYVTFTSCASDLVTQATDGTCQVYVRDRLDRTTVLASLSRSGVVADQGGVASDISNDGRYVAFESDSTNLVGRTFSNGQTQVYLRDLVLGTTQVVSRSSSGQKGTLPSGGPSISGDGRYVAFYSNASNLVPGDTNATTDIFVRDIRLHTTVRASVASDGSQIAEGAWFRSSCGCASEGSQMLSQNGRFVVFEGPADNLGGTIYLHDLVTGITAPVDLTESGNPPNGDGASPSVAASGKFVVFSSYATNLVAVAGLGNRPEVYIRGPLT